jgi:subtilisin
MADTERPAWSRGESIYQPLAGVASMPELTREWAWGGARGEGVRVAVIDSGIDAEHPALGGAIEGDEIVMRLTAAGEILEEMGRPRDAYGHGTACAGIIHAIAPGARITSVQVLGGSLTGKAQLFLRGLAWAVEKGFDVINLSLGTTRRDWALPFHEICDQAYFRGCLIVTAANNYQAVSFPSLFSAVASVACNLATDPFEFHVNPQPPTEFLARGIEVDVPWMDGATITVTGNSFAAAHLSGIAALIRSKHPGMRPFQVKTTLWGTASNVAVGHHADAHLLGGKHQSAISSSRALSAIHPIIRP